MALVITVNPSLEFSNFVYGKAYSLHKIVIVPDISTLKKCVVCFTLPIGVIQFLEVRDLMMTEMSPPGLIQFLLQPESYPEKTSSVAHVETHISHVFVGDTLVYKIKKPVNFGFLDFSSLKKRLRFCEKEVALNSRLARGIYLDVVPVYRSDTMYSFQKDRKSRIVEYAVKMKRIPMECLLFNLIMEGKPLYRDLEEVGRSLATFHQGIKPYMGRKFGGIEIIHRASEENFNQVKPFLGMTIDEKTYEPIMNYTWDFLEKNGKIFSRRNRSGFIREGHGDLHCQHICLERPPIIFDCIEFNDSFRIIDVLEDIAFLFMDLEYRGRFDLTSCLLKSYFESWQQAFNEDLLRFYKVYRAVVRGKVEGLTAGNVGDEHERETATLRSRNYFALADYYVHKAREPFNPVVFMGLSGSGKSTIARDFAANSIILRSDEIRKETSGINAGQHLYGAVGEGIYSPELTRQIYCSLVDNAVNNARKGRKVIVDATYLKANQRKHFYDSCISEGLNPFFVHFFASEATLRDRIRKRMEEGTDISDAHPGVLEHQLKHLEEPDELPSFRVLRINTEDAIDNIVNALKEFL
jgi:aminoglycoside phosphotransferase family enzyme/predicted kinase